MPTPSHTFSQLDLGQIFKLMDEYTSLLRVINREMEEKRIRSLQQSFIVISTILVFVVVCLAFSEIIEKYLQQAILISVLILAQAISSIAYLNIRRNAAGLHFREERERIITTLKRLVELASQYHEKTSMPVADRLEAEIRMAAAEAAIRVYEKLHNIMYKERNQRPKNWEPYSKDE